MDHFSRHFAEVLAGLSDHPTWAELNHAIQATMAGQHRTISVEQLRALRVSAKATRSRVRSGLLFRSPVARGIFQAGPAPLATEGRRWAGLLWAPEPSWFAFDTAAAVLALEKERRDVIHLVTRADSPHRKPAPGVKLHRATSIPDIDTTVVNTMPSTAFARTMLDLASTALPDRLDQALDQAERLRLYDHASLGRVQTDRPTAPGIRTLGAALGRVDENLGRSRSWLETKTARLVQSSSNIPRPIINRLIDGLEMDISWFGARAIIEADGRKFHRTAAQIARDAAKEEALLAAGYVILRLTWDQVVYFPHLTLPRIEAFYRENRVPPTPGQRGHLVVH